MCDHFIVFCFFLESGGASWWIEGLVSTGTTPSSLYLCPAVLREAYEEDRRADTEICLSSRTQIYGPSFVNDILKEEEKKFHASQTKTEHSAQKMLTR